MKVCSVHYKICVTKIHHVVILHMLKIYLSKSQGKFKFKPGKLGKSQGIFCTRHSWEPWFGLLACLECSRAHGLGVLGFYMLVLTWLACARALVLACLHAHQFTFFSVIVSFICIVLTEMILFTERLYNKK